MPNTKSTLKKTHVYARRKSANQKIVTTTKNQVKSAHQALQLGKTDKAGPLILAAVQALDKAAQKGVIHKNNAARKKSRILKQYNKLAQK